MGLEYARVSRKYHSGVSFAYFAPSSHPPLTWALLCLIYREEDECVDPYMGKVDPVDAPATARTPILVALSSAASLWEHELPPLQLLTPSRSSQRARRVSLQTLPVHTMLPKRPYRSPFDLGDETVWESASGSESESDSESGLDDDWHQFRVEWIDFDVAR